MCCRFPDSSMTRLYPYRQPVHPSINEEQVSELVDHFYQRIAVDPRLAPIFRSRLPGDWAPHLQKMKLFWSSVLLRTGKYSGSPVQIHQSIPDLSIEDFQRWLDLFYHSVSSVFEPEAADLVKEIAARISRSFKYASLGPIS